MLLYFVVLWIKKTFYSLPKLYNINDIMKQCNILKINQLYKLETASLMFKLMVETNLLLLVVICI